MIQQANPKDYWIVISGVSRGLGLMLTHEFLQDGWSVAGLSTTHNDELEKIKAQYTDHFFWKKTNIADTQSIENTLDEASVFFQEKKLWSVINNAGMSVDGIFATLPVVDIEKVIQVNLIGSMCLARAGIRKMMQQKTSGRIINISSITGSRGYKGLTSYAASKAGMDGFTRALAREVGRLGITVNSVAPGYMQTKLSEGLNEQQLNQIIKRTPMGRLCKLEDVVNLVTFINSHKASFITGQVLTVDGGLTN